ncbi:MAG: DUF748 domain-containing protein [Gammaproteobacteria bacterium]
MRRSFQIGVGVLVLYALLGFLLAPVLIARAVPKYVHDTLHRQASIGAAHINPFLLTFTADNVKLREADGKPIAAARRLFFDFSISSLFRRAWTFSAIRIDGLYLNVERAPDGALNLARLIDSLPKPTQSAPKNAQATRILLWDVAFVGGRLAYVDRAGKAPASVTVTPIDFELKELSTLPDRRGAVTLKAQLMGGGELQARAAIVLHPFTASGQLALKGFPAATAWPFLRDHLRLADLKGVIDLDSAFHTGKDAAHWILSAMRLHARDVDLRAPDMQTPLLALATLDASGGKLDLSQHTFTLPQLALSNGPFALVIARDGTVNWARLWVGDNKPTTKAPAPWRIALDQVQLNNISPHVIDQSRAVPLTLAIAQLGATLKLGITTGPTATVTADAATIDLARLIVQASGDAEPALRINNASLRNGALNTGTHNLTVAQLNLRQADARLARDAHGHVRLIDAFAASDKPSTTAAAKPASPWRYRVTAVHVQDSKARLTDAAYQPALTADLDQITATLHELTNDNKTALRFDAAWHMVEGGRVSANGALAADHRSAQGKLIADKVNLAPLQAVIARHTTLSLKSGAASAAAEWQYTTNDHADALVSADGSASIEGLSLNETRSGDRFFGCNTTAATGIHYRSSPGALLIDDVRVIEPLTKVLIFPDRSINLIKAFEKNETRKTVPAQVTAQPAADEHFPIKVTRVRVERGVVDYTDQSLVLPFSTTISDFRGTVSDISSDIESRAKVRFEGRIEQYGSAEVNGTLSPFAPKHYMDIHTKFTNVEMPKLSPYSATFAGREVATGKLTLDLEYKIEDGKLAGDNLILLDHFTLGKVVPSKDALDLPLDLAVALLTDSKGHIDIAIPVTGDLTKPSFALGKVVAKAITQAISKIVTAPFRALGKLLGGGDKQQFDAITFSAGSAQLAPPQLEKLKQLAEALTQRPQLSLVVEGRYDPDKDGTALRAEHVRRAVSNELGIALSTDERPAPVVFDEAKTQRALEALYKARAGAQATDNFQTQYEAKSGKPVERVNPVLAVFGKPSLDQAFYEALYKELVQTQALADNELPKLAEQRATAVVTALVHEEHIAPARVTSAPPKPVDKSAKNGVDTTLKLSVAGKAR